MKMGVTVPTGSPILVWVNSVPFVTFVYTGVVQTKYERRANESHNQCGRNIKVTTGEKEGGECWTRQHISRTKTGVFVLTENTGAPRGDSGRFLGSGC